MLLVVDQPNTIGLLPLAVARDMSVAVGYLPGSAMRKAAQLLPDTLRDCNSDDETMARLKVLSGFDDDLAWECNRQADRLRSLLLQTTPRSNGLSRAAASCTRPRWCCSNITEGRAA